MLLPDTISVVVSFLVLDNTETERFRHEAEEHGRYRR